MTESAHKQHFIGHPSDGNSTLPERLGKAREKKHTGKPKKYCRVDGCIDLAGDRSSYCGKHRARIQRHGDPHKVVGLNRTPLRDRFMSRFKKDESGCWLWTGQIKANGYGQIGRKDRTLHAHRVAYELFKGPVPPGMCVCHSCDVRNCVNPDHLWLGTQKENLRDMHAKGRARNQFS